MRAPPGQRARHIPVLFPDSLTMLGRARMGQGAKRLEDMRRNPRSDWQIKDIAVVCSEFGIVLRDPTSGSHYKVTHQSRSEILTIPAKKPIKPVYIRQLVAFVDFVRSSEHGR